MDVSSLILPGAQSLVTSILTDGWTQARATLARRWSKHGSISQEAAEKELEAGHQIAQQVAEATDEHRAVLQAYWAGYLAGLAKGHGDLLDAIRELSAARDAAPGSSTSYNTNTGQAGTLLQTTGDISVHGDFTINR